MMKFEQDKIGRKEIVEKICWLVENLQKDQHFCLALNGEWGSGKSFVLEYIEETLHQHEEYIIVKYDAWKNNFYQDPLIAILYCVLDSVKEYFCYVDTAEKKFKRVGKFFKESLQTFAEKTIGRFSESSDIEIKKLAVGYYVVKKVAGIIKEISLNQILNNEQFTDFKSYQDLLKQAQALLNEVADYQIYEKKQTKLIILVDEIDRCLPDEQLRILERLHHLFAVKNCGVICAVNKGGIINNYHHVFNGDGKEYLKKFFEYEFELSNSGAVYFQNRVKELCNRINQSLADKEQLILVDDIKEIGALSRQQSGSVRDNKKLFDRVESVCNEIGWTNLNFYYFWFIVYFVLKHKLNTNNIKEFKERSKNSGQFWIIPGDRKQTNKTKNYYIYDARGNITSSHVYYYPESIKIITLEYMVNKMKFCFLEKADIEVSKIFTGNIAELPSNWEEIMQKILTGVGRNGN